MKRQTNSYSTSDSPPYRSSCSLPLAIGWREAVVTLVVIPTTILLTLFASNLMSYTINRVSLFALIFSIGILVDDAIVVVENIARHWAMNDGRTRMKAAVEAVAEVGNPTVVATLTVVAALLPMLFVSGLMGPYMAPIPANASSAMLFSFFVAMVMAPWLMLQLAPQEPRTGHEAAHGEGVLGRIYRASPTDVAIAQAGLDISYRRRRRDVAGVHDVRDRERNGETAAVRQQVGDGSRARSAGGCSLEDTERTLFSIADTARPVPEITLDPDLRGHSQRRLTSMAWSVTLISGSRRNSAICISILRRREIATRSSHAIAVDLRRGLPL